jgi:hypothetical protein
MSSELQKLYTVVTEDVLRLARSRWMEQGLPISDIDEKLRLLREVLGDFHALCCAQRVLLLTSVTDLVAETACGTTSSSGDRSGLTTSIEEDQDQPRLRRRVCK